MQLSKPKQRPGIVRQATGGEVRLCNAAGHVVQVLTPTAQVVWQLCDGQHTVHDMVAMLRGRFAVPDGHDIADDVRQILAGLHDKGLLQDAD